MVFVMAATRVPPRSEGRQFLLFLVLLGALICSGAAESFPSSLPNLNDDWGEFYYPGTPALNNGGSRHLLQSTSPNGTLVNGVFELATSRTDRPNPLDRLKEYTGGYNLSSRDYGASVGYTGLPAYVVAIVWVALGFLLLLSLLFACCCCRHRMRPEFDHGGLGFILPLLALVLFTIAAIVGSFLLYYAQGKFNNDLKSTLNYVVNQSAITEAGLRQVSSSLTNASNINIGGFFTLSAADKAEIVQLNSQLNSTANDLHNKTWDNRKKIKDAINIVRIVLMAVAAVMLALVLLGLLFSACGIRSIVYLLVLVGWILVAATWILCGIFIFIDNGVGDTCLAMKEWVDHPEANTSLDRFLPCDGASAASALTNGKDYTSEIVGLVNAGLANVVNPNFPPGTPSYYNQTGPPVPSLCNPYGPAPDYAPLTCPSTNVTFSQAAGTWAGFRCNVDANGLCTTPGRLTPEIYSELTSAANTAGSLTGDVDFLVDTANCTFVRTVFSDIQQNRCHDLRKWTKWIWIGLILISAGSMLSILSWIVFIRRRRYRYQGKQQEKPMYKG